MKFTRDQFEAARRHAISFASGAIAFAGTLGVLNAADVKSLTDAITQMGGALASLATAIGIISTVFMGMFAKNAAAPEKQLEKAVANNAPQTVLQKVAESPSMGVEEIKAAPAIAMSTPSAKVTPA